MGDIGEIWAVHCHGRTEARGWGVGGGGRGAGRHSAGGKGGGRGTGGGVGAGVAGHLDVVLRLLLYQPDPLEHIRDVVDP